MVTLIDVARVAGVSRSTASYALRLDPRITKETTQKVLEAAEKLHYTANLSARSLKSFRTGVIGLSIFELDKPYPAEISAAISREARRHGLETIVQQTDGTKEQEISSLRKVTSQLCDGTIFCPAKTSSREIAALSGNKPLIMMDDISEDPLFDNVFTPCEAASAVAIRHLIQIGCKQIVVFGGHYEWLADDTTLASVGTRRVNGALEAFDKANMSVDEKNFFYTLWDAEEARRSMHRLIESEQQFDGLFCMTDSIAIGALRGLNDYNIKVPDDVAVIGFDGISEGEFLSPSLSTIKVDFNDMAKKTVGLLLDRMKEETDGPKRPINNLYADFTLVQRESTTISR